MAVLTILLIAIFLAAWKAPAWVKELGLIAMAFGVVSMLLGFFQVCDAIEMAGEVPQPVLCGGIKVGLIPVIYGMGIYIVSLILRIVQKPRI